MAGWIRRLPPQMKGRAMARAMTTPRTIVATDVVEGLYQLVLRAQTLRQYLERTPDRDKAEALARAKATLRSYPSGATHDQIAAQIEALEQQIATRSHIDDAYVAANARIEAT